MKSPFPLNQQKIATALRAQGIRNKALHDELLDHFLCVIEAQLDRGCSYEEAEAFALGQLKAMEVKKVQRNIQWIKHKNWITMNVTMLLLSVLTFWTLHNPAAPVDLFEPPHLWPIEASSQHITSGFGMRLHPVFKDKRMHNGIDIRAKEGTAIIAPAAGLVKKTGYNSREGNFIILQHDEVFETKFMHLSEILVEEKAELEAGDIIGKVGNTGFSFAPHLHYEVIKDGKRVDPLPYMKT